MRYNRCRKLLPGSSWRRPRARRTSACCGSGCGSARAGEGSGDTDGGEVLARGRRSRLSASAHRALAANLVVALTVFAIEPSRAAEPGPVKIAVFDFELEDKSAGGGIIAQDAIDTENLKLSTEEARRMLSASGRYTIVDAGASAGEAVSRRHPELQRMRSPAGQKAWRRSIDGRRFHPGKPDRIHASDRRQGHPDRRVVTSHFTGLRMGANYAWPRGVKWLMDNRILSAQRGGAKVGKGSGLPSASSTKSPRRINRSRRRISDWTSAVSACSGRRADRPVGSNAPTGERVVRGSQAANERLPTHTCAS